MKKLLTLASALALMLVLAACSSNPAPLIQSPYEPDDMYQHGADSNYNLYEPDDVTDLTISDSEWDDTWANTSVFASWTGSVVDIITEYSDPPTYIFHLEGENGSATFTTNFNTFILGDTPEVGDTITGFYLLDMPMTMIYPPQFTVSVIVNGDFNNVAVDRFDEALVSYGGDLMLEITNETEIMLQDGEVFDCILYHRKLVVVYDISTRSIPAITTPSQIIVLFETPVTGPAFL